MTKKNRILLTTCIVISVLAVICIAITAYVNFTKPKYKHNDELYGSVGGRDYRGHVGDGKFEYPHVSGINCLIMNTGKNGGLFVLDNEYDYYTDYYGNLYYYAADGYAVVYAQNNLCKVYLTETNVASRARKIQDENIVYLDSFDEFTKEEQARLKKLR